MVFLQLAGCYDLVLGSSAASKLNWLLRKDLKLVKEVIYKVWSTGQIARSLSLSNFSNSLPKEFQGAVGEHRTGRF